MPSYQITEPHPSVAKYTYSGRGGAGNTFKAPKTTKGSIATGPASHFEQGLPVSHHKFASGRGGAGNIRDISERAIFSFDEEIQRQATRDSQANSSVYHTGRGGAGNWNSNATPSQSRKDSSSSTGSTRSGFLNRISHTFERR